LRVAKCGARTGAADARISVEIADAQRIAADAPSTGYCNERPSAQKRLLVHLDDKRHVTPHCGHWCTGGFAPRFGHSGLETAIKKSSRSFRSPSKFRYWVVTLTAQGQAKRSAVCH